MSDDVPTQRFEQPPARPDGSGTPQEPKRSRALLITLIVVGAVLLVAIIVILVLLLNRRSGGDTVATSSPTPTVTHSATPSSTPSPTTSTSTGPTPPPAPALTINSFSVGSPTVACDNRTGNPIPMSFTWTSTNGSQAFFGVNTTDAQSGGMGWNLPPSGSSTDFPQEYDYPCYNAQTSFTITVVDAAGDKQSKTLIVTNTGDTHS
jgi:hypothetical protein